METGFEIMAFISMLLRLDSSLEERRGFTKTARQRLGLSFEEIR